MPFDSMMSHYTVTSDDGNLVTEVTVNRLVENGQEVFVTSTYAVDQTTWESTAVQTWTDTNGDPIFTGIITDEGAWTSNFGNAAVEVDIVGGGSAKFTEIQNHLF